MRQKGAKQVKLTQVSRLTRAQNHGDPLSVEGSIEVTRILQGSAGRLQGQEMERLNRRQAAWRHAVGHRVEGNVIYEAAPLGVDLVSGLGVRIIVPLPIPAIRRDLCDGVDLVEDVLPVGLQMGRLREYAGHPDNRDVRGLRGSGCEG